MTTIERAAAPQPCLLMTSFPDLAMARQFGAELIERQLAACVKLLPQTEAIYSWEQQVHHETEVVMWIKTLRNRSTEIQACLRLRHPYQTPEFIVIAIDEMSLEYQLWLNSSLARDNATPGRVNPGLSDEATTCDQPIDEKTNQD